MQPRVTRGRPPSTGTGANHAIRLRISSCKGRDDRPHISECTKRHFRAIFVRSQPVAHMSTSLVREYYTAFNERRIPDASALFTIDATLEHLPFAQTFRGPDAYMQFAELWLRAFPDAVLRIEHIEPRGDTISEVDLIAEGTHVGILELGTFGSFKPTGQRMAIRIRELLEMRGSRIG